MSGLLSAEKVGRRFGGLAALEGVDLTVEEGEVVGLIGPNGAGKTTLFNCVSGLVRPTAGTVWFRGVDLVPASSLVEGRRLRVAALLVALLAGPWAAGAAVLFAPTATFPLETSAAFVLAGLLRVLGGVLLGRGVPWSRPLALLCAVADLLLGGWVLLSGKGEGWLAALSVVLVLYPLPLFLFLLRREAGILFGSVLRPDQINALGMARTFQNIRLFPNLPSVDNVKVGRHGRTRSGFWGAVLRTPATRREESETARRAEEELSFVGLGGKGLLPAGALSYGDQRRLEIARALATDPVLLLLDEPAAGMNPQESEELVGLIRRVRGRGIAVLLIEHDMKVIMRISDRIVVLDHGQLIAQGSPSQVRGDPRVIEAYLGSSYQEAAGGR